MNTNQVDPPISKREVPQTICGPRDLDEMDHVVLPARAVALGEPYDVLIVGGGLAGVCAAVAAARHGVRTLLTEALPFVGGNATIGLPLSTFRASGSPPVIVGGIALELLRRLRAKGAVKGDEARDDWIKIDCDQIQFVIAEMLDESGVEVACYSPLWAALRNAKRITHAVFMGKDDVLAHSARCFVDCSGDAALAYKAGLETPMGRMRDGKTQAMTLVFSVGNIDENRYEEAGGDLMLGRKWDELRREVPLRNPRVGGALSGAMFIPGRSGEAYFNATRILVDKGTDARHITRAEIEGRYQVDEFVSILLRPHIPGFERCYLSRIAHRVGVRETRRIRGEYELTEADLLSCKKFPDSVACNSYPVDIHSPTGGATEYRHGAIPEGDYYTIPYRCLVAKGVDNLLAAGRCLSATHEALSAVRVNGCAMPVGQAAGTAAALCAQQRVSARDLDMALLRDTLKRNNAITE